MPGLQRRVLPVVREAEELPRLGLEIRVALQFNQRPHGEHRGGGAAVVHAERCQLGTFRTLVSSRRLRRTWVRAEQEVPSDQGSRNALPFGHQRPPGIDKDRLGKIASGVGSNALLRLGGVFPS